MADDVADDVLVNVTILVYLQVYVFNALVQGIVVVLVVHVGSGAYLAHTIITFLVPFFHRYADASRLTGIVCLLVILNVKRISRC